MKVKNLRSRLEKVPILFLNFSKRYWGRVKGITVISKKTVNTWNISGIFILLSPIQTVQRFEYVKSECFFITKESGKHERDGPLVGCGGMLPHKILKSWCSEMPFLVFWEDDFCLKCLLNIFDCHFYAISICLAFCTRTWYIVILCSVLCFKVFWISVSVTYSLLYILV